MTPSQATPSMILDILSDGEETFLALIRMLSGGLPPENVCVDIDPYHWKPENLPGEIWYSVKRNGNTNSSLGQWRQKGGDCKLYSNSTHTGWRTTYEYFGGQAPERKRPWIMYKYWMSRSDLCENSQQKEETTSLCKVFCGDEPPQDWILKTDPPVIPNSETIDLNHQLVGSDGALNKMASGSSRNFEMSEEDEMDCFSERDYLELDDLNNSSTSSSENCSCIEDDSDFDTMPALEDIESEINHDRAQREAACIRSSVPSKLKKQEVVQLHQGAAECVISIRRSQINENLETESTVPEPGRREPELKLANRSKGAASSSSKKKMVSNGETDGDGEKKSGGIIKKIQKKYFCFRISF